MNFIFFGSSEFAKNSLLTLSKTHHKILAVYTLPGITPISSLAKELGLKLIQPDDITAQKTKARLKELAPDIFVVVAYGRIFDSESLRIPRLYPINLHGSLLPEYRGAAPIHWAIIRGATVTGVTVSRINERLDSGDILLQRKVALEERDDSITLSDKLSKIGAEALVESLGLIEAGSAILLPQDEARASYAPRLRKNDGLIDWSKDSYNIYNLVRGTLPWPGAFTFWKGKRLKIYRTHVTDTDKGLEAEKRYGEIIAIDNSGIVVNTGKGKLTIEELQMEGGKKMGSYEFAIGHKIESGDMLCQN